MKYLSLIRYGGLKHLKQRHYNPHILDEYYHRPPEKYGMYAFIENCQELFLLGGEKLTKKQKINRVDDLINHNMKRFKVYGEIWTHIVPDHMDYLVL